MGSFSVCLQTEQITIIVCFVKCDDHLFYDAVYKKLIEIPKIVDEKRDIFSTKIMYIQPRV